MGPIFVPLTLLKIDNADEKVSIMYRICDQIHKGPDLTSALVTSNIALSIFVTGSIKKNQMSALVMSNTA